MVAQSSDVRLDIPGEHTGSLAVLLKSSRHRRGLSARALSAKAGLAPSYVTKLESGSLEPSFRAFAKLVTALNLNSHEIIYLVASEACSK